jgi:hypothetical protein
VTINSKAANGETTENIGEKGEQREERGGDQLPHTKGTFIVAFIIIPSSLPV